MFDHTALTVSWPDWNPAGGVGGAGCHRVDNPQWAIAAALYHGGDIDSMCYACVCSQALAPSSLGAGFCDRFEQDNAAAKQWAMVAIVLVNFVNQLLKRTIVYTSPWLKAHTMGGEMASKVLRIFMCQLVNTALLVLLVKSAIPPFADLPGDHYSNVNAKWYSNIAAPMMATMAIQFIIP